MSGADHITFNVRERPSSTDWNNLQSMEARTLNDLERYIQSAKLAGNSSVTGTIRNCVPDGLLVTPNGADVSISAGVLMQETTTLAPAPGSLDSSYRMGINRVATTQVMPAPGVTTFYLLEGQVAEVTTTTESRDILDPATGSFVPTNVPKQVERHIVFQLTAGGASAPAPVGGNWVPIAIIRRPGGGGAVVVSDVIDARPLAFNGELHPLYPRVDLGFLYTDLAISDGVRLNAIMDGIGGVRSVLSVGGNISLSAAEILQPALGIAANTWYFLYLAPWAGTHRIAGYQSTTAVVDGVLVLSDVVPSEERLNSAPISLPAPFSVTQAPVNSSYMVAAVRRNAANTGWAQMQSSDLREFDYMGGVTNIATVAFLNPPGTGANAVAPAATIIPAKCKHYRCSAEWIGAAAATDQMYVYVTAPGDAATFAFRASIDDFLTSSFELDVPSYLFHNSPDFDVYVSAGVPNANTDCTLRLTKFWY